MTRTILRGVTAAGVAGALTLSVAGLVLTAGPAAAASVPTTDPRCATTTPLTLFNINDFHGRIEAAPALFTPVEELRATQPDVALLSAGDNIGGSTFVSMVGDDMPTIDVLNAAGLKVSSVGNHEFDGGWAKLRDTYIPAAKWTYVAANMTGTTLAPYKIITTASGVRVAVIGAEVKDLPSLVSPSGLPGITVSAEVPAVNAAADKIAAAHEADVIVAEVHNNIQTGYSSNVDAIFNGHTHETYANVTDKGQPVVQAASYGTKLGRVDLKIGQGNVVCGNAVGSLVNPAATPGTQPAIVAIQQIVADAKAKASAIGQQVIGTATAPVTRGSKPGDATSKPGDSRSVESTMSDLVAQMFYDTLSNGNPEFIGLQNPGGTRADFNAGEITYEEAALVLPFANTLMTTQITGAQLKTVLEQQWQRDATGAVPSRPYLQLGLSDNVTYTYDESRPEGDRITSITVNGKPVDPAKLYTVGSGSFLIAGGDNFFELAKGVNTTDTGKIDLQAWTDWIRGKGTITPTFERQAVALSPLPTTIACDADTTFTLGTPPAGAVALDTLNFSNNAPADQTVTAYMGTTVVGTFPIVDGKATVTLRAPQNGEGGQLVLKTTNGTTVRTPATFASCKVVTPPVTPAVTGGKVVIAGAAKPGKTVKAVVNQFQPEGVTYTYVWKVDGKVVGTGATYTVKPGDAGKKLTVTVTASAKGYTAATVTSAAKVVKATPVAKGHGKHC